MKAVIIKLEQLEEESDLATLINMAEKESELLIF